MKDQLRLKSFQSQETRLLAELEDIKLQMGSLNKQAQTKKDLLAGIRREIQRLTSDGIIISEHAILRYVERILGINLEEVKQKILSKKTEEQYELLGNGEFPVEDKFKVVIKDNVVITVKD